MCYALIFQLLLRPAKGCFLSFPKDEDIGNMDEICQQRGLATNIIDMYM